MLTWPVGSLSQKDRYLFQAKARTSARKAPLVDLDAELVGGGKCGPYKKSLVRNIGTELNQKRFLSVIFFKFYLNFTSRKYGIHKRRSFIYANL